MMNSTWGASGVDVFTVPVLQHQEVPDPRSMVRASAHVIADELVDGVRPEVATGVRPRVGQHLLHPWPQLAAKPRADGDAEPALAAFDDLRWKTAALGDALEDPLGVPVSELHRARDAR